MKKAIIFATVFIILNSICYSQEFSKIGSVGAQFLKIGVGSRYQGMAETSVAVVNDAYSMYWNPAGLANIRGYSIAFTNVNYVTDVSLNYIGFGAHIEDFGTLGFAATLLSSGDMEITTVDDPDGTGGTFSASSFSLATGYARYLTTRLSFGASIKYIYEKIYSESSGGIAFDLGTQLNTGYKSLRIGMNISNLGPELKFSGPNLSAQIQTQSYSTRNGEISVDPYELPLTFRLGMAFDLVDTPDNRWTMAIEAKHPNDKEQQGALGAEYCYQNRYFLRSGYKFNYSEQSFSAGGGLIAPLGDRGELVIDYAWSDFGRLDSVHRFSLGFKF